MRPRGRFLPVLQFFAGEDGVGMSGPLDFSDSENPFRAPLASSGPSPFAPSGNVRNGPPWEQTEKPLVGRFVETVVLSYTNTLVLFGEMRRTGGLGAPLLFAIISGTIGMVLGMLPQMFLQLVVLGAGAQGDAAAFGIMAGMSVGMTVGLMIVAPLRAILGAFIWSGIYHVMLLLFRSAHFPFEATFRAVAYGFGASSLIMALPCCGQHVYLIVSTVFAIIAIMKVQEISGVLATAVVVMPLVICCGAIFVVIMAFLGLGMAAGGSFP